MYHHAANRIMGSVHGLSRRRRQFGAQFDALGPKFLVPGTGWGVACAKHTVRHQTLSRAYEDFADEPSTSNSVGERDLATRFVLRAYKLGPLAVGTERNPLCAPRHAP
jgi:hypothetical protein